MKGKMSDSLQYELFEEKPSQSSLLYFTLSNSMLCEMQVNLGFQFTDHSAIIISTTIHLKI